MVNKDVKNEKKIHRRTNTFNLTRNQNNMTLKQPIEQNCKGAPHDFPGVEEGAELADTESRKHHCPCHTTQPESPNM